MFPLFALALNLPEDYFDDKVKSTVLVDDRVIGIGAHTDVTSAVLRTRHPGLASSEQAEAVDRGTAHFRHTGHQVFSELSLGAPLLTSNYISLGDQFARWTSGSSEEVLR
ncbi:uncharacterized protein LAESUDRAFT_803377 [Laetiporus sulphureus 93-53]|uniref:Uncharacterized protein n=1 Tax=Laetiporus sulphureus 93-53 TaxID=1314785 RepID=A0A165FEQ7_9APHY|nr:uncharacterized protein LAESUDRAFT_803377 [Laetiporus sulphureus 93-53]KZT08858.1 hypothetical protein LAESUDRAFT_803377 [Laetiporus sulphureus 93-53]